MVTKRAPITDWSGQTLFGKWKVEHVIGVGGTSTVLQARHRNGRRAALKILHPHLAAHGRTRERFVSEGRLANLVDHPGVVSVLDDFMTDDGTAVLVLELVQGKTLATLAKGSGGVLAPRDVVVAAMDVLDILAVAHDANVIHRDIKPENILRCADGTHKLADFGLAALCHELGMLTGTNASLGTPAYMSPEQARGDALQSDARTDIWGLGATMFTLLTGRYLHAGSVPKNLVVAAATEQAPSILAIEPAMQAGLAEIVDRALKMDKESRWPNARAMLAELRALDVLESKSPTVRATVPSDVAGMPTAPSSLISWSHGGSTVTLWSKRRLFGVVGVAIALASGVLAWQRLAAAPAPAGDQASAEKPSVDTRPANTGATVSVIPSAAPAVAALEAAHAPPIENRRPQERAPVKTRALSKIPSEPSPSPSQRVSAPSEDLSVPDDVLDRRE